MRKILALLAASTALTAAVGASAWSAADPAPAADERPFAAALDVGEEAAPAVLASDDGHREHRRVSRQGHDDDRDDDDDDHDDDDDDDRGGRRDAREPAPAGPIVPPQNGLFGDGAPPQVKVN